MKRKYDFGVLRSLRQRKKMTLEELAKVSGLTYPTVASIENNKARPSLKTLDALASALNISAGNLVSLAENNSVLTRRTETIEAKILRNSRLGLEKLWVSNFDKCKVFRATARARETVRSMELHEDCNCHEICYVLRGSIDVRVKNNIHGLSENDVILFDGTIQHEYMVINDTEFLVIHLPQDIRTIDALLKSEHVEASEESPKPNNNHRLGQRKMKMPSSSVITK